MGLLSDIAPIAAAAAKPRIVTTTGAMKPGISCSFQNAVSPIKQLRRPATPQITIASLMFFMLLLSPKKLVDSTPANARKGAGICQIARLGMVPPRNYYDRR